MTPTVGSRHSHTPCPRFVFVPAFLEMFSTLPCVLELSSGIVHDGLWDVYNDHHMGICAEKCSAAYGIGRGAQDEHATESYERAALAWDKVR